MNMPEMNMSTSTRRALVQGAAWTVPVVAVATSAPYFAASPCSAAPTQTMTLSSTTSANGQKGSGTDGTTISATSALFGGISVGSFNLRTNDTDAGMGGWLEFEHNPRSDGVSSPPTPGPPVEYQTITLTFSQAVMNLKFDLADLDSSGLRSPQRYNYWDALAVGGGPPAHTTSGLGSALTGVGSLTNPWRQTTFTNSAASPNDAATNRLTVNFAGPITTFTVTYWTIRGRNAYSGTHATWLGNMTYQTNCT